MTPERWRQVENIFQTALDLPVERRASYLSDACGADSTLHEEVVSLLASHETGDYSFEDLVPEEIKAKRFDPFGEDLDPLIGKRLGAYEIVREIGRGGMGAVYEAVRVDKEFKRRVAIKLVKRGMDTDFILRRFRKERQILAALDHANIAGLLDGGTTDDGLPYFVMEFIEGQPLYQYCDVRKLSIGERLKLFSAVCDAVHYAHQKQVVHRDIKPSNVLVTSDGVPKLLDFGIAKLLNPELAGDITHDPTATAMRLMTPEYASPEQVQGAPITPSTDVYSLGVLLYELLSGHRPYRLFNRAPHEIARVICEEPPAPLSIIITRPHDLLPSGSEAPTLEHIYLARSASVEILRRDLGGALEDIVSRALRKEPQWRYPSAAQLGEDVDSFLEGRPLSSLPDAPYAGQMRPSPASAETALAVLPLKLIDVPGNDSGSDYLGAGLTDALITRLSSIQRFAVRPTSSVLRYSAEDDPLQAGKELGVAFVIDGRVRHSGERIRVTLQLLDVNDGTTAWAGQFDENFTDVLTLEDTISSHVAAAIVPHLTVDEKLKLAKRGTNDPLAHEAYLRGRSYWNKFTEDGFAKAIVCYHQATAIDPDYAVAHAAIAEYYNWLGIYSVLPSNECGIAAYEAAATAVAIDPLLAEAHCALGQAKLCRDFAWDGAERQLFRAIQLNPNYAPARTWYAFQLAMEGRFTEASREAKAAVSLDPFSIITRFCRVWCLYHARQFEAALEMCREYQIADPENLMLVYMSSYMLSALSQHEEAIANAERCVASIGKASRTLGRLGTAYAEAGKREQAEAILQEMDEVAARRYISPYHVALVQCALGRVEAALDMLERAVEARDAWVLYAAVDPELDNLHGHPRFDALLRKLNHRLASLPTLPIESHIGQESIAVLPFKVLTQQPMENTGDEYLGIGLADALITRLSNVRRLVVRPTSSVLRYRGVAVDPLVAGRDLHVDYVIDGSLRRVGERLRVTAQLMDVVEGVTSWAEQFDEESKDVLQIEDSISERVTAALLPQLTGDERVQLSKRGTANPKAFEWYLRGRYHWNTYTESGLARAIECYNHAIKLDPNYALAYTGIADYFNWLGVFGVKSFNDCTAAAKEAAQKAIELDPSAAEAYSALGFATIAHDFDWSVAEAHHRRAIEINPNYATGHHWYSFHLLMTGRFDDALREILRARELDPLSPSVVQALGWCYYQSRRNDESIATHEHLLEVAPEFSVGVATYAWALRAAGRADEAVAVSEKALQLSGGGQFFVAGLGQSYAAAGRVDDARAALRRLKEMSERSYVSPYHTALVHLHLGEYDKALALLREAFEVNDGWLVWIGVEPAWDVVRGDPVFEDLLSKTRNPAPQTSLSELTVVARRAKGAAAGARSPVTSAFPTPVPETTASEDEEARQLFTAGRYYATRRTAEGLRQAIQRLERAVELKPDYAVAYAELADCYALMNWFVEPPPAHAWQRAKQAALSAVRADPNLAEAHASLGFVRLHFDRDWEGAERELQKAIVLNPRNQVSHRWYAYSLSAMGRHDEAYAEIERAREITPQSPVIATALANVLFLAGRFDDTIAQCRKALELDPGAVAAHTVLRWAYERKGMVPEALAAYEQERSFAGDSPTTRAKRAHVLAATGHQEEARKILEEIIANRDEHWVTAYEIAIIYSLLGDRDKGFEWLAQAEQEHAVGFTFVRVDPHLENLRSDPRFANLLRGTDRTIP